MSRAAVVQLLDGLLAFKMFWILLSSRICAYAKLHHAEGECGILRRELVPHHMLGERFEDFEAHRHRERNFIDYFAGKGRST